MVEGWCGLSKGIGVHGPGHVSGCVLFSLVEGEGVEVLTVGCAGSGTEVEDPYDLLYAC